MGWTENQRKAYQRKKDGYIPFASKRKRRKQKAKNWCYETWRKWKEAK